MGRNRVLSFISQFTAPHRDSRTPTPASSPQTDTFQKSHPKPDWSPGSVPTPSPPPLRDGATEPASTASSATTPSDSEHAAPSNPINNSPSSSPARRSRRRSMRPLSMVQTYQPPVMDVNEETLPELQPIFTLLNSHSNKLYQEGYFLKLDDQDIRGKPNPDRTWAECFAQLVGTILSLWDATELDAAGEDGEVLPKFINLTDASIKMIESLPTKSNDEQPLQNILSISTAGRNRYLLHFNSHHSLIQWTAGIRLAMFEHATLQEAYTGALIAGKGKGLNNINIIMERVRQPIQQWVRVRFGAGVPWRRCWCVIDPPSEKEYQKALKDFKKRSPYDRSHAPILKGEIRFYDSKKEAEKKKKHQRPIASITDAYSTYAIYPQSKALIDGSTLLKIEGDVTIYSEPPSSTEGFVFIMPETHPAVAGFEMLLRFLFPTWDTFGLYGRPGRLVASSLDPRSLMFAMPKHRRYGYLELLDVSGLILTDGSSSWSEREWRKRLKGLTGQRMATMEDSAESQSRSTSRTSKRLSYGGQNRGSSRPRVGFADDDGSGRSSRSLSVSRPGLRTDSAPPDPNRERAPSALAGHSRHSRNISDTVVGDTPPAFGADSTPFLASAMRAPERARAFASDLASTPERVSSEDDSPGRSNMTNQLDGMQRMETPEPVNAPPAFAHSAGSRPLQKPYPSPELRRATNRLSSTTLSQLAKAGGLTPDVFSDDSRERRLREESAGLAPKESTLRNPAVRPQASTDAMGVNATINGSREATTSPSNTLPAHGSAQTRPGNPVDPVGNPSGSRYPPSGGRRTPSPGLGRQQSPHFQGGSPPIHRKPLPARTTSLSRDVNNAISAASPTSPPRSFASQAPATRFGQIDDYAPPPIPAQHPYRQTSERRADRMYDDTSSTASPDYASSRHSTETEERVDRPRAGVLKTTGDDTAGSYNANKDFDIPEVNFGPTFNYGSPLLPSSKPPSNNPSAAPHSPHPLPSSSGRKSPGPSATFSHFRQESGDTVRRSVVWQPGATIGASATENAISPEQFVQQRAATPHQYSHQRSSSTNTLMDFRAGTPTSSYKQPGNRGASHSRHSSAELLSSGRPVSQALSGGEVSSHLSAREQEHVARVTGSPLISLAGNKGPSQTQSGLVGAIHARERERAQMKMIGIGGSAVAQAIDHRQREQSQQAQRAAQVTYAQQQAQFAAQQALVRPQTPAGMGMMGGAPSPVYSPSVAGMNVGRMSPGPGMISHGPGMMSPGSGMASPPLVGPGFQSTPNLGASQPWPPMMPQQASYGGVPQGAQGVPQGGGWNMANLQHRPGPPVPSPGMEYGVQGGPPQSPTFQLPPQGQYARPATPAGLRPGTPGRMQFQGQAF